MQLGRNRFVFPLIFSLAVFVVPILGRAETRIGVAETQITPPLGFPMAGYYFERLAAGTHDPLKAKAIAFLGDTDQAAIVVCDLTGVGADLTAEVRKRAEVIGAGVVRAPGAKELPRVKLPQGPKDQPPYAHPYYWAGFVLVGDPD